MHHVPRKDNDATDFLTKLSARRDPSLSGIFIHDLHELSARILEGLIQTHLNAKPAPEDSDPNDKPMLGGSDPSASMTMSPADITILALDQTNWRASLLAYLLKEVLPPERTKA